jgi:two-component system nitrogen regulation response regulator NtrX
MKPRVLLVDDEKNIRRTLGMILGGEGYQLREAKTGDEALVMLEEAQADLVLLDVNLPGTNGIEVLKQIKQRYPATSVVMISGQATVSVAVEATRAGAFDFMEKPLSKERVLIAARNALAVETLSARVTRFERAEAQRRAMIGESAALEHVRRHIEKAGPSAATVLITGESGTGKELVARALHETSPRHDGPFVKVNCAAIPEELIETELFGCLKGAYTGADRNRDGKFLLADGGTIFLDEIGDMSLKVQAKVLRALQEGEIERVGGASIQKVDVRVLAATNKDLAAEVEAGRFREDLFYRLNVVPIGVPALRDRAEDIPRLCEHFLALYAQENDLPVKTLSTGALAQLRVLPWRGNIRELRNIIERLAILSDRAVISEPDIETLVPAGKPGGAASGERGSPTLDSVTAEDIRSGGGLNEMRRQFEKRCVEACLDHTAGNVSQAARWLGIERSNLHKKMQALGLEARPSRPAPGSRQEGDPS